MNDLMPSEFLRVGTGLHVCTAGDCELEIFEGINTAADVQTQTMSKVKR